MDEAEHPNIVRVRGAAAERGLTIEIMRFPAGTRTAEDAARAIGCDVAQIVKSLVFIADGRPLVVLVSGVDRVDTGRLASEVDASTVARATGDEARAATGFAIGGIPPIGHSRGVAVLMDPGLLQHGVVWAAAGLPDAVFAVDPHALRHAADARLATVAAAQPSR